MLRTVSGSQLTSCCFLDVATVEKRWPLLLSSKKIWTRVRCVHQFEGNGSWNRYLFLSYIGLKTFEHNLLRPTLCSQKLTGNNFHSQGARARLTPAGAMLELLH